MIDTFKQFRWIVFFYTNLLALFHEAKDVAVASHLPWHPLEATPDVHLDPDIMVVFGRPRKERSAYRQWEEGNVPAQVVFDVQEPDEDAKEVIERFVFYRDHGIEEYYLYNLANDQLAIYRRKRDVLRRVRITREWVSPRMGIRFDRTGPHLVVYRPDGERFRSFEEISAALEQQERMAQTALKDAEREKQRGDRLAEQLRLMGINPDNV